jgi:hypothetical protein
MALAPLVFLPPSRLATSATDSHFWSGKESVHNQPLVMQGRSSTVTGRLKMMGNGVPLWRGQVGWIRQELSLIVLGA